MRATSRSGRPASISGQGVGGYGAAVHPADQVAVLEHRQVAADGLGGDVVLLRELDHGDPPRSRTSWVIACWRSAAYTGSSGMTRLGYVGFDLCLCCSTPEYVDCQGGAELNAVMTHSHLQGTPVVPGVAHAPALRGPRRGRPARHRALRRRRVRRRRRRAGGVRRRRRGGGRRVRRQGRQGERRGGRGAHRERRAWPATRACARRSSKYAQRGGAALVAPCTRRSSSSSPSSPAWAA